MLRRFSPSEIERIQVMAARGHGGKEIAVALNRRRKECGRYRNINYRVRNWRIQTYIVCQITYDVGARFDAYR